MPHTRFRSLAARSALVLVIAGIAAARPRYGGTLRVEFRAPLTTLDPAKATGLAAERLLPLIYDRLTDVDDDGRAKPALAVSWQVDRDRRRWQFRIRAGVKFHDGTPLSAQFAAQSLAHWGAIAKGDFVTIRTERPWPDLPVELARVRHSIGRRSPDGTIAGTGPFRVAVWESGRRLVANANEDYWNARPYVDSVEVVMGRQGRERTLDLESGRFDIVEVLPSEVRRAARLWSSPPSDLLALCFRAVAPMIRENLMASIDLASIHTVLLQRQGEFAKSLLPQWLSGYAFLFTLRGPRGPRAIIDLVRPLRFSFDGDDPIARAVAERIIVNVRSDGPLMTTSPTDPDVKLVRARISALDSERALNEIAAALSLPAPAAAPNIDSLYHAELGLLKDFPNDFTAVPLFHLPNTFSLSSRLRDWKPAKWGGWRLEEIWIEDAVGKR